MRANFIDQITDATVRDKVRAVFIRYNFQNYNAVADEIEAILEESGLEHLVRTRATVAYHGKRFQNELEALRVFREQARLVAHELGDDEGSVNDMLIALTQQKAYELLGMVRLPEGEEVGVGEFAKIGRVVADLGKASVQQKMFQQKVRDKLESLETEAKTGKSGLDMETLRRVQQELYGL